LIFTTNATWKRLKAIEWKPWKKSFGRVLTLGGNSGCIGLVRRNNGKSGKFGESAEKG
jgi:hypothetical protein